jgi:trans-aconitate 2-methyltransferase
MPGDAGMAASKNATRWEEYLMKENDLWDGRQYKENSSPQEFSATGIINGMRFSGDEHILDIGCGDGKITHKFHALVPRGKIIGIDASASMLAMAREHFPGDGHISFYEKIAEDFRFDESFDFIFSFHTLHWVKDKVKVYKNVRDHLAPQGKFVLVTSGRQNGTISGVFLSDRWKDQIQRYGSRFHSADAATTQTQLEEAGLSVQRLDSEYWSTFYADKSDLIKWLMTWVPYATGLNAQDSVVFAREIAENMLEESEKNGVTSGIEFKTEMLVIEAERRDRS